MPRNAEVLSESLLEGQLLPFWEGFPLGVTSEPFSLLDPDGYFGSDHFVNKELFEPFGTALSQLPQAPESMEAPDCRVTFRDVAHRNEPKATQLVHPGSAASERLCPKGGASVGRVP